MKLTKEDIDVLMFSMMKANFEDIPITSKEWNDVYEKLGEIKKELEIEKE